MSSAGLASAGTDRNGAEVRQEAGRELAKDPWQSQHKVRDYFGKLLIGTVVLSVTIALAPGISAEGLLSVPIAVVFTSFLTTVLQPLMIRIAVPFGWFGAAMLAVFGNFIVMYLALNLAPGIDAANPVQTFLATWIYSILMAVVQWVLAIDGEDVFLVQVIRQSTRGGMWGTELTEQDRASQAAGGHPQLGVVFVQLDGMPAPVLDWAVKSGNLPTLSRWIRSGEYTWAEWHSRVPSTTPVAQAGLLHGTSHNMPAFRWYEKDSGELIVANHPPDAAKIESRISNGRGLLADSGVSISNLFSGDAQSRLLVMSGMSEVRKGLGPSKSYASFFTHPAGFTRAFIMTVGEMFKERFQARAQVKRDIVPRISRKGSYVALRAVTNVLLRDLNIALVIEAMMNGSKSIYVDFVDYDEIAHHAGVQRPESLRALEGLDQTLAQLERVVRFAPRPYRFVCVSDHGQSQGSTFKQRYGEPLEDVVRKLMGADRSQTVAATADVEDWGPLNTFLSQLQRQPSVTGGLTKRAMRNRSVDGTVTLGPATLAMAELDSAEQDDLRPELVVVGSGNLGGVWFGQVPGRVVLEGLELLWPGLAFGLATHPGISFILVRTHSHGPVVMGARGLQRLRTGEVEGDDPLAPFEAGSRADLLRIAEFSNAPDIYLNSMYDPTTDEVAAFEELVGCHGGIGGWQTRAILVHPNGWRIDNDLTNDHGRLDGAEAVHRQLVRWLEQQGHRQDLGAPNVAER